MELKEASSSRVRLRRYNAGTEVGESDCLYTSAGWVNLLQQYYKYTIWQSCQAQERVLVAEANCMLGSKLIGMPFSDYWLPQVPPAKLPAHLELLHQHFPNSPLYLKIPGFYALPQQLPYLAPASSRSYLSEIPVEEHPDKRMPRALKASLGRAAANRLQADFSSNLSALRVFYHLYYRYKLEWIGKIPEPFTFFRCLHEQFIQAGKGFYALVRQRRKILAVAIVLQHKNKYYYRWGGCRPEGLGVQPINLLFYALLKRAAKEGVDCLSLGVQSGKEGRGLSSFKQHQGCVHHSVYTYRQLPKNFPQSTEKKLQSLVNDIARLVVQHKLSQVQTQSFSRALRPLLV